MVMVRKLALAFLAAGLLSACSQNSQLYASQSQIGATIVGGQPMLASKNIVANASQSADHTTLVAALKQAGLVSTLQGPGPFTVFAPTNDAFAVLPPGTVNTLMQPQNKAQLTAVLTYHVVPGLLDFATLNNLIATSGGKATLKTVNGATLTATMNGARNIVLTDAKGRTTQIETYDVYQSNGVIHVVDKVMLPS